MLSRYVLFLQSVFRDCGWPIALADIPVKVNEHFPNCLLDFIECIYINPIYIFFYCCLDGRCDLWQ